MDVDENHIWKRKDHLIFEEYKKYRLKISEIEYQRYKWLKFKFDGIVEDINLFEILSYHLEHGSKSFHVGAFTSCILSFTTGIEIALKAAIDKTKITSNRVNFNYIIKYANNQGIISDNLKKHLHYYRKEVRNILVHEGKIDTRMSLGWTNDTDDTKMLDEWRLNYLWNLKLQRKWVSDELNKDYAGNIEKLFFTSLEVLAMEAADLFLFTLKAIKQNVGKWRNISP